jgi:class 3 adenylate cyclase/TolB-like protein/Flp pilus assembly protein TadD
MQRDSRIIAAILAADVVGYSRLMGADESAALAALKSCQTLFIGVVREYGGREFGSAGDSFMSEFHSAVNAVSAALTLQERLRAANAQQAPDRRTQLRIGVNLGDVIEEQAGVFGDAVNVAARLQALAKPGGILISAAVYDQVHHKVAARFLDAGTRQVKNIADPVHAWEVLPPAPPGFLGRLSGALSRLASLRLRRGLGMAAVIVAAVLLGLFWREIPVPATGKRLGELLAPDAESPPPDSIAVLPFVNLSGDPANDYLGDGMAEELMHRLARIPGLRVAARTSTFAHKGKETSVRDIADALGVAYVVEGSVKRQGDRVRVNAALVERATGANRWSNSYESSAGDFFAIENDIGARVIAALELVLESRADGPAPAATAASDAAYDYFLQGLSYLRQPRSARSLDAAEELFGRALAEQGDFARAQAGLCETRVERYALEREPAHVAAAEDACAKAQALDNGAPEVHAAVGRLRLATGDVAEAESAYRRALAIVPESPDVLMGLATALATAGKAAEAEATHQQAIRAQPRYAGAHNSYGGFLFAQGRAREAVAPFERATVLAPDNANAFNNLCGAYIHVGDFGRAADACSRSLAIEPRRGSYSNMGTVQYYRGRFGDAAEMFRKAIELSPGDHRLWGNLADALRGAARDEDAAGAYRKAMTLVEGELAVNAKHAVNQAQAAYYSSRLGNGDRARQCIELALAEGDNSNDVHYYVALAELGLGRRTEAAEHARRARELGYPEILLKATPELAGIQDAI